MIEIRELEKSFGGIKAVDRISLQIREQEVFGLIGTNGAGKSTLLRMLAAVLRPDAGTVMVDREIIYDNPKMKERVFFIADEPYFFPNATGEDMRHYYRSVYRSFDSGRFDRLMKDLGLDPARRIAHYSKGMKKQLAVICGVSAGTKYLLCDETFDGLDPVMRQGVKSIFAADMTERGLTPVIASHNLRELEDICDHVGLLHQGGVLLSEDIEAMKLGIQKVQCVFLSESGADAALEGLTILKHETRGRLHTLTLRGIQGHFQGVDLAFFEMLPLTLEEVFISETEVAGYDVKKIILG